MFKGIYGEPPVDLGLVDLAPAEMMFWLYCPVKLPGRQSIALPDNLAQFRPILEAVYHDCDERWRDSYIYVTAKTLWVTNDNPGNRPGWHSDGFMTDDLNYIWSDRNGTEFWVPEHRPVKFTQDHQASLIEMGYAADAGPVITYPDKHLLRLDETVIHRVAKQPPGIRTFIKVSVSTHLYDLVGNSINHAMPKWTYAPRSTERNHPSTFSPHHGEAP